MQERRLKYIFNRKGLERRWNKCAEIQGGCIKKRCQKSAGGWSGRLFFVFPPYIYIYNRLRVAVDTLRINRSYIILHRLHTRTFKQSAQFFIALVPCGVNLLTAPPDISPPPPSPGVHSAGHQNRTDRQLVRSVIVSSPSRVVCDCHQNDLHPFSELRTTSV